MPKRLKAVTNNVLTCHEDMATLRGGNSVARQIGGGPFSHKLPPKLAISRNMAGIGISTQQ